MRRSRLLVATAAVLLPFAVAAQDVRLRGAFSLVRAPAADTRPPTGEVRATVDDDGRVRMDLVVSGMNERATSVTLHTGNAGESTQDVARLDVTADGTEARVVGGRIDLTPIVAAQIRSGAAYVVLHTSQHPDGFLRAQLAPQARTLDSVTAAP